MAEDGPMQAWWFAPRGVFPSSIYSKSRELRAESGEPDKVRGWGAKVGG
jgi:hypothetical protein